MNLNRKLNFNNNTQEVMERVNHKMCVLVITNKYLTTTIKMYMAMILPYLDYGYVYIWGETKLCLDEIQRPQNRALKI